MQMLLVGRNTQIEAVHAVATVSAAEQLPGARVAPVVQVQERVVATLRAVGSHAVQAIERDLAPYQRPLASP